MKIIKAEHTLAINNVIGDVFLQNVQGGLELLETGMEVQASQILYLALGASVGFSDKTRDDYILRNFDTRDIADVQQKDLAFDAVESADGLTKIQEATVAGAVSISSSISEPIIIEYDNDQILSEAGFDTDFQRQLVIQDEDFVGEDDQSVITQTQLIVGITIDSISQDDVVTALESKSPQLIVGSVSGDAKVGDIISVFIDGIQVGETQVVAQNGQLIWTVDVDGKTLLQASKDTVSATVTTQDDAGNSASASSTHDYLIDIQASITINPITGDNIITQSEGNEAILPITGFVGKDVQPGDRVTVTIDGNEYTTTVNEDLSWTVNVTGEDILKADQVTASVTTNYGAPTEATASDTEDYNVVIEASITIDSIADDGIINQDESEGKVPITGSVGNDVKPGDVVTITIGDETYTTTVNADKTWTVEVDGSALVENGSDNVNASVTTSDIAGHSATATTDKPYEIDTSIEAVITINDVTADNIINEVEATETIPLNGNVGGDVKVGDIVTVTVDGNEYTTAVIEKDGQLVWEVDVPGSVLANASVDTITATVTATDSAGNEKEATSSHDYEVKTLAASITIDDVTADNTINATESTEVIPVSGKVGGGVKVGDVVTVTIDGNQYTTPVIEKDGQLIWTVDVDGKTLLQASKDTISATVTTQDDAGNSASASSTHDYLIDIQASITINPITGDNIITQSEGNEAILPITGFVGKDVLPGDRVTVTIDGNEYTTTVNEDLSWTVNVTGEDILKADQVTASVTTNYGAPTEATASDTEDYNVVIEASITIDSIADDGIINQDESEGKVPITGSVGNDVKPGDVVTITIGDETYTTTVNADKTWTVEVDGSALVENGSDNVNASVTTSDIAGHSATATTDKPYEIDTSIEAVITINDVTTDNIINEVEATETIPLNGNVGGDVKVGDIVTVTVDGNEYTTAVIEKDGQLVWEVDVPGSVLANASVDTITATVTATDSAGNEKEATSSHDYEVKTLAASITIDDVTADNTINATESTEVIPVSGKVGGGVKVGDVVTVTIDGNQYTTPVIEKDGQLIWTVDVDGTTLLQASKDTISATVTTQDDAGNSASASSTHDYLIDIQASITINPITGDNIITQSEGNEAILPITGFVGKDVQPGDRVTVTIDGNEYTTTVNEDLSWTVNVTGEDILKADQVTASVTTNYGAPTEATASDTEDYNVVIEASITIDSIADDGIINQDESEGKVPITGSVGNDVKPGDVVTITIGDKTYTTTVNADKTWTVEVDGSALVENGSDNVNASVTTSDIAGHSATATTDKPYELDTSIEAVITINDVTADNIINEVEATETIPLNGNVGGDVKVGDIVTVTVDGNEYTTAVIEKDGQLVWEVDVPGSVLANASVDTITATVTATDSAGNEKEATSSHDYEVKTLAASITIDDVTADNTINETEATEVIPVSGKVGGGVKVGDVVTVTIDGNQYTTPVIEKDGQLIWTVDVDGSVLTSASVDTITATVTATDTAGNVKQAISTHDYEVKTLDVSVTVESINNGDPITGTQYDNNELINVSGLVGGDAKEGDTVTLHFGDSNVQTSVVKLPSGELGYIAQVPGGLFVPNSNDGFTGEIQATISISDAFGNTADSNADKNYDTEGEVITGDPENNTLTGTGYNDLIIGDSYVKAEKVAVNLVLDLSGSMSIKEVQPNDIQLVNGNTSGTVILTQSLTGQDFRFDFSTIEELSNILSTSFGSPLGFSQFSSEINFEFPSGVTQKIDDIYTDIGLTSRIDLAKSSIKQVVDNYGDVLNNTQLSELDFTFITFATAVDSQTKFSWDFTENTLVTATGVTISDYLTSVVPLTGGDSLTNYDPAIVDAINSFDDADKSNIVYFITDGMDTVEESNGEFFDKNVVINQTQANLTQYSPIIVPISIGSIAANNPDAQHTLNEMASLGFDYEADNTGNSQVIIASNTAQLDNAVNNSFGTIIGGNDIIHGGKGDDFIVADTLNNTWLLDRYGSGDTNMSDVINSGTTLSEVLYSVVASEQGVDVDSLTMKDIYQFVQNNQSDLVVEGSNNNGKDTLFGDEGDDILFGSGSEDELTGGPGDDLLFGQSGNDILIADAGNDILNGGAGEDIFQLNVLSTTEPTTTTINDFETDETIDISSILETGSTIDDLLDKVTSAEVVGNDISLTFENDHKVELKDVKDLYVGLGTSTEDIVTTLFNNDVFNVIK